eukprot:3933934-Rhodomonas_salina.5
MMIGVFDASFISSGILPVTESDYHCLLRLLTAPYGEGPCEPPPQSPAALPPPPPPLPPLRLLAPDPVALALALIRSRVLRVHWQARVRRRVQIRLTVTRLLCWHRILHRDWLHPRASHLARTRCQLQVGDWYSFWHFNQRTVDVRVRVRGVVVVRGFPRQSRCRWRDAGVGVSGSVGGGRVALDRAPRACAGLATPTRVMRGWKRPQLTQKHTQKHTFEHTETHAQTVGIRLSTCQGGVGRRCDDFMA